jgi:pseudooxynicotine dehydrogenase
MADCDAVVIGGGFAGVVAARELTHAGREVILLEGRDRLGGRTWYKPDALGGRTLELGGTWVHWLQPHVWAEITRYGLDVVESLGSSAAEEVFYVTGGQRKATGLEDVWPVMEGACDQFCSDAAEVLPRPYEPLWREEAVAAIDASSVQDRIDKLDLTAEQRDLLNAFWSTCCSARCGEGGLVAMLRWYALAGWNLGLLFDAAARYKLKDGTAALIEAIVGDGGAQIRLSAAVEAIDQDGGAVTVTTRTGEQLRAAAAVVTVPLNTLGRIRFTPGLSALKRQAAEEGQASHGSKLWVEVRGDLPRPLFALAPDDHPLQYLHTEELLPDGQLLVGFGCDAAALDVTSIEAVTAAVRVLVGDVEVVATTGHDWLADEFSRGTWPVLRPNQVVRSLRGLQTREGRVCFAGSETANGWNGFIDGAIESGLRAAREAQALLSRS